MGSRVHGVPENGHQPLGRGNSLWRSACLILWSKPVLLRYFTRIAPLCSLALRHGNTKVPVWTHESIGYPKVDISHWDAVIHYGVQLAQYCDPTRPLTLFHGDGPCELPCPKSQENQSTCVVSWVHRVPENGHQPLGRGNYYGNQLAQYCDQTRSFNAISRRSPPVYSLALILRNSKVPVWTHESIGCPKMDISHSDADIHYSVQLAQYCDPTRSFNAISRRSPPVYSLAL